jgi:hypothetical protein
VQWYDGGKFAINLSKAPGILGALCLTKPMYWYSIPGLDVGNLSLSSEISSVPEKYCKIHGKN